MELRNTGVDWSKALLRLLAGHSSYFSSSTVIVPFLFSRLSLHSPLAASSLSACLISYPCPSSVSSFCHAVVPRFSEKCAHPFSYCYSDVVDSDSLSIVLLVTLLELRNSLFVVTNNSAGISAFDNQSRHVKGITRKQNRITRLIISFERRLFITYPSRGICFSASAEYALAHLCTMSSVVYLLHSPFQQNALTAQKHPSSNIYLPLTHAVFISVSLYQHCRELHGAS